MDARQYLEQVRRQRFTLRGKEMDLAEARETFDLLRGASLAARARGSANANAMGRALEHFEEIEGAYVGELMRWNAMRDQAVRMLDRAREVLVDGSAHAVDLTSVEIVHRYYIAGNDRRQIAGEFGLSVQRVDQRKREALLWLDENRGLDGMPLVPLVSE